MAKLHTGDVSALSCVSQHSELEVQLVMQERCRTVMTIVSLMPSYTPMPVPLVDNSHDGTALLIMIFDLRDNAAWNGWRQGRRQQMKLDLQLAFG